MRDRAEPLTFRWIVLAGASFVVGLAAVIRMAGPNADTTDTATQVIQLPQPLSIAIVSLFGLTGLVLIVHAVRRTLRRPKEEDELVERLATGPPPPAWVRMLMRILPLVYLVVGVYLVWNGFIPLPGILELSQGAGSGLGSGLVNPTVLGAPAFLTWTFGLVALATALGFFAIALVVAFGDRILWWGATTPPDDEITFPVAEVVEESVDDLRTDPDPRRAIMGCYRKFERVAADSRLARRPWWTPAEFMAEALRGLPAPPTAVATLTSLFELARFSHHALGGRERDLAIEALLAIKASVESRPADAITA